jgi:hypothetical protein
MSRRGNYFNYFTENEEQFHGAGRQPAAFDFGLGIDKPEGRRHSAGSGPARSAGRSAREASPAQGRQPGLLWKCWLPPEEMKKRW